MENRSLLRNSQQLPEDDSVCSDMIDYFFKTFLAAVPTIQVLVGLLFPVVYTIHVYLPIYLVVTGAISVILMAMSYLPRIRRLEGSRRVWRCLVILFLLAWIIAGPILMASVELKDDDILLYNYAYYTVIVPVLSLLILIYYWWCTCCHEWFARECLLQ